MKRKRRFSFAFLPFFVSLPSKTSSSCSSIPTIHITPSFPTMPTDNITNIKQQFITMKKILMATAAITLMMAMPILTSCVNVSIEDNSAPKPEVILNYIYFRDILTQP